MLTSQDILAIQDNHARELKINSDLRQTLEPMLLAFIKTSLRDFISSHAKQDLAFGDTEFNLTIGLNEIIHIAVRDMPKKLINLFTLTHDHPKDTGVIEDFLDTVSSITCLTDEDDLRLVQRVYQHLLDTIEPKLLNQIKTDKYFLNQLIEIDNKIMKHNLFVDDNNQLHVHLS